MKFVIRIINEQNKGFGNLTNSPLEILTKTTLILKLAERFSCHCHAIKS